VVLGLLIGAVIGLHELDDALVVILSQLLVLMLHSIESEYNYPLRIIVILGCSKCQTQKLIFIGMINENGFDI
jgi:hypothetical protein